MMECRHTNLKQKLLTCSIISLPFLFIFWVVLRISSPETFQLKLNHGFASSRQEGSINDMFLGGLLASGFNRGSCLSRYESASYRKGPSNFKPSSRLISLLRRYEDLHRRCGPYTHLYNKTIQLITTSGRLSSTECNYVVWLPFSGLGNRMLTLSSAFLYALLTNRVLLVDPASEMDNLFCEPFLQTSWLLTQNFPLLDQLSKLEENPPQYYGQMLKSGIIGYSNQSAPSSFLYLNLAHDYDDHDKLFFCDQDQEILSRVPWLILRSNNYFIPYLFLIPSFESELESLFPEKEAVFHHLGRYLFHPTNEVWGLIARYYEAYLAKADKKIGIQIRVLESGVGGDEPYPHVMEQILACTRKEAILPTLETGKKNSTIATEKMKTRRHKAVLVTSLNSGYYEKMRDLYWENPTTSGEAVEFYQASHEEVQHSENRRHNSKAWAEIYLLSLTDELVTSSWSTFGYVAQGLGGLRPWILTRPVNRTVPEPACKRAMSIEPCFHAPPDPKFNCPTTNTNEGTKTNEGGMISHVKQCEDRSWGLKLFD